MTAITVNYKKTFAANEIFFFHFSFSLKIEQKHKHLHTNPQENIHIDNNYYKFLTQTNNNDNMIAAKSKVITLIVFLK